MSPGVPIDYDCFEELIRQLRSAGHEVTAQKLDDLLHGTAWTTGSELIGELGLEILAFQKITPDAGVELQVTVRQCLEMVRRIWPNIQGSS